MSLQLVVHRISKSYDGKAVLRDCSVSFNKSGAHILTGVNGSGKSTFLRMCALIENPITLVLPGVGIFNTTVFKNVAYGLKVRGIEKKEIEEKTLRALAFVRLTLKKENNALTLSSGEMQRLGIARALVIDPEILFLDEPTAFIDQENTEIIEDIILKMKTLETTTVIITTHYREQAQRLADMLLVIKDGRIFDL
jgi:tungstate transport system ATP-binding protein